MPGSLSLDVARPLQAVLGTATTHSTCEVGGVWVRILGALLLLASQFSMQPLAVSEAAQRCHALQNVRVQLSIGRQAPHGYPAARGWLQARVWFVFPAPGKVQKHFGEKQHP